MGYSRNVGERNQREVGRWGEEADAGEGTDGREGMNRKKKGLFAGLSLLLMLLLIGCGWRGKTADQDGESPTDRETAGGNNIVETEGYLPQKTVVQLEAGGISASAVCVEAQEESGRITLLTSAHGLSDLGEGELPEAVFTAGQLSEEERIPCDSYFLSQTADYAVLTIINGEAARTLLTGECVARQDRQAFDALKEGDACLAVGGRGGESSFSGEILSAWIYMEDYGQYMIWAKAEIEPGMSGGGLFDGEGNLVGILSGGTEDGELAAVPVSIIWSEWAADGNG